MEFATGALGTLLPKLGQLLKDEYNLQKGAKKNIEFLTMELECIQAALRSVGEVQPEQLSELVKIWARDARELSYDMEDIVVTFLVRVQGPEPPSKRSSKRFVKKMRDFVTKAKTRHEIGKEIKDIKERVKELAARRDRYNKVDAFTPAKTLVDPRISSLYTMATDLVGIDEAREEFITRLTKADEQPAHQRQRILSIVGFGGLGKTTLSKLVYDKLKGQFDCTAFVPVGRNPDLKKVFKDILIDLGMHFNLEILDERQLINKLREFLANKRYFIVIDDVWDTQCWGIIKLALVENNSGSRIIITTRSHEVAREAGELYKLQPLSDDNSRKLFFARIFGGENKSFDHETDEVSDKILRKCDGVPLAIITMASLLAAKPRQEWSDVHRSIGFGNNKENRQVENTMKILSFSYYDLPSHLKTCLLHLSVFPEDYLIHKKPLIWMWIAEGFVHKKRGISSVDIGEGYFNELINRSLIQLAEKWERCERVICCQVHDMVLDLIRSISSEENFITVLDNNEGALSQGKARRLALHNDRTLEAYGGGDQAMDMQQVRSFVSFQGVIIKEITLFSFELVRVLCIETFEYSKPLHLEHLWNLLHLRYLRLSGSGISFELPEEIGALKFLQTLDVEAPTISNEEFEVVTSVGLLTELLCLRFGNSLCNVPDGIEKLTSLEELDLKFSQCSDELWRQLVKQLGSLGELRMLHVHTYGGALDTEAWEAAGFLLPRNLQQLFLRWITFSRFPSFCINPSCLPNLSHLSLELDVIDEQDLRILGRLPELRFLELRLVSSMQVACRNASTDATGDECLFQKLRRCRVEWGSLFLRLLPSKGDISFHVRHVSVSMHLGYEREDAVLPTLLPSLQELWFTVYVREFKDGNDDRCCCSSVALEYFASLQNVKIDVNCHGASAVEVEEVEAVLRHAADVHPNRPTLEVKCYGRAKMVSTAQDQEGKHTGTTNDDEACMSVVEINPQGDGSDGLLLKERHGS